MKSARGFFARVLSAFYEEEDDKKNSVPAKILSLPESIIDSSIGKLSLAINAFATPKNNGSVNLNMYERSELDRVSLLAGQDAIFYCKCRDFFAFGVFDGVGGFIDIGIDSSKFSHALATSAVSLSLSYEGVVRPIKILEDSFKQVITTDNYGGSTACMAVYNFEENHLQLCNVGDSGFILIRDGTILRQSKPQHTGFNNPNQMCFYVHKDQKKKPRFLGPTDYDTYDLFPHKDDVLILYSDGFSDNIHQGVLLKSVKNWLNGDPEAKSTSCSLSFYLGMAVHFSSTKSDWTSPFSIEAAKHGFMHDGGKQDDISILAIHFI